MDHTPVAPGENRVFGEQVGPGRSARAIAIVQIAVADAIIAVNGGYRSYTGIPRVSGEVSTKAAVAYAAHRTLVAMFPSQKASFDAELLDSARRLRDSVRAIANGVLLGKRAADAILNLRSADGSQHAEPVLGVDHQTSDQPGHWRQDPISLVPVALGAHWGEVRPFVLRSGSQFRAPPPAAMTSDEYTEAFNEVKRLGGDGITTPTERTEDQTFAGIFWAYDGTPSLCAPPRLYNQIARHDREEAGHRRSRHRAPARAGQRRDGGRRHRDLGVEVRLRLLAAGRRHSRSGRGHRADRPGRRQSRDDRRPDVHAAGRARQQSATARTSRRRSRPIRPATRASAGRCSRSCGGSTARTTSPFTFVSDEFNGVTRDNDGNVRPLRPRSFTSAVAGGGGERPEPHLPRHPLVVRQERRHHAGRAGRRLRVVPHLSADALVSVGSAIRGWRSEASPPRIAGGMHRTRKTLAAVVCRFLASCAQPRATEPRYDLLIRNASVVDGTGAPAYRANVLVKGDTIAAIDTAARHRRHRRARHRRRRPHARAGLHRHARARRSARKVVREFPRDGCHDRRARTGRRQRTAGISAG